MFRGQKLGGRTRLIVGLIAGSSFTSCSFGQYAEAAIRIYGEWGYSLSGLTATPTNVTGTLSADTFSSFRKIGGPGTCTTSEDLCPAEFSVQDGPTTVSQSLAGGPLTLSNSAVATTTQNSTTCQYGYSVGCGGNGSNMTTAFANVSGLLSTGSGGLTYDGAANVYTNAQYCDLECEGGVDRYALSQAALWCKGAQTAWDFTGSGTIDFAGVLDVFVRGDGGYPGSCSPSAGAVQKFGQTTYRVIIENNAGYYREFTIRLRVFVTGIDGSVASVEWDNTIPSDIVETSFSNGGRTNMSLAFVDGVVNAPSESHTMCGVSSIKTGSQPRFTAAIDFAVPEGQTHRWKLTLATRSDIVTPSSDLVGSGTALACLSDSGCPSIGGDSDGVIDGRDLKALVHAVGTTPTDCGFFDELDWDQDGEISEPEILPFLCNSMADVNEDGFLDFFDYDDFVYAWENDGLCVADLNLDGFLDFFDYDLFVFTFESRGCLGDLVETLDCAAE